MDSFNWKQYILNYPDLQDAYIINETLALSHYSRFGKSEGRTDQLFNIPITIITPCVNQENLEYLKESINFDHVNEWIIVYDTTSKKFEKIFNDSKISEYFHSNPESVYGHAQRNYALEKISNPETYIYFLDDDNLMHPDLFKIGLVPNKIYSFNQHDGLTGKQLRPGNIDTGMVLMYYPLISSIKWKLQYYESDGIYIQECYLKNKGCWYYINRSLCYYNKLVKTVNTFKGYSDLKNSKDITLNGGIPKLIFKTSWYTRESMHPEIKKVLQKTISMNKNYELYYFDDSEMKQFIGDYDPTFRVLRAFNKLVPGAFKCDLFRYCLLDKYGGCYSDIGHTLKTTFDSLCYSSKLVLVEEIKNLGIHNGLICCTPGHPLMKMAVQECLHNIENGIYGETDISITGPAMLAKVYRKLYLDIINNNGSLMESTSQLSLKMLKHVIKDSKKYIYHDGNEAIITKFDNYDHIMYPPGKVDYHILWNSKKVFNG
jgi:mannosyltransferase OCH1-like enzyme